MNCSGKKFSKSIAIRYYKVIEGLNSEAELLMYWYEDYYGNEEICKNSRG